MIDSRITGGLGGAGQGAATGAMVGGVPGAIVGGIIGGIGGILSGGGEEEAQKAAEEQAKMIEMQAREAERRKIQQTNWAVGETKARTYASNILDSGSAKQYRGQMESEYRRQLAYDRMVTKKQVEYTLEGGQAAADTIGRMGVSSMFDGFASAGSAYAKGAFGSGGLGSGGGVNSPATNKAGGFYGTGL